LHDLREEARDDVFVERFAVDWRTAGLPAHTYTALAFAEKLTLTPHQISQEDIQMLRRCGYRDEEVHDIVQIAAYFNYINRIADALGVPPEEFMQAWPREDGCW
jgi:uncharacterized peroxidase-related enzyme